MNSAEGLINILSGNIPLSYLLFFFLCVLIIRSGNAGKGGDASSGDSVGGGADNYEKHSSHDNDCDC